MTTSPSPLVPRTRRAAPVALAAALLLRASTAAAQVGSGTVDFTFTSFGGPFAASLASEQSNPANWILTGRANGVLPTATGWVTQGTPAQPDLGYVTGTTPLAPTTSVTLRYDHLAPGEDGENLISFTPRPFTNVARGEDFVLGTLSFENGFWVGGGDTPAFNTATDLGFRITTTSPSGALFNQTITGTIRLVVNQTDPNVNDVTQLPGMQAEADWVYIVSPAVVGTVQAFRVYDLCCHPSNVPNVGTVDVIARFNSLELVGLANAQGGGFITSGATPLPPTGPTAVPEPATWALLAAGLAAVGGWRRRVVT